MDRGATGRVDLKARRNFCDEKSIPGVVDEEELQVSSGQGKRVVGNDAKKYLIQRPSRRTKKHSRNAGGQGGKPFRTSPWTSRSRQFDRRDHEWAVQFSPCNGRGPEGSLVHLLYTLPELPTSDCYQQLPTATCFHFSPPNLIR